MARLFKLNRFACSLHAALTCAVTVGLAVASAPAWAVEHSQLWGERGELWAPDSRLPDFSFAGYHRGEDPLPDVEQTADITTFGADGSDDADDTEAFRRAIEGTDRGAIFIPAGRYVISDILEIRKSNLVLRGAGPEKSILYFSKDLEDVRPNMGATTTGDPTSNYSWSGGFLWVKGQRSEPRLANVIVRAARGDCEFEVDDAERLRVGQAIRIYMTDDESGSLIDYLYAGDSGPTDNLRGNNRRTDGIARITGVDGRRVTIDRSLPNEIRTEWQPRVHAYQPNVVEVGIEHLGFEFPNRPYAGHFTERGANPIAISDAADSWVRNVRIHNADSGIFVSSHFCTVDGVVFTSERGRDRQRHSTGHHGIEVGGDDNLIRNFDFRTRFIHDLTVARCHGNVFCDGHGEDLSLDHHKYAPYANLFTNLDAGAGTQLWVCGGGADLGKHCAAWGTFWNIRAERNLEWPPDRFGPALMNLVGLTTAKPSQIDPRGRWFEAIPPADLVPQNLWDAQRNRRLNED